MELSDCSGSFVVHTIFVRVVCSATKGKPCWGPVLSLPMVGLGPLPSGVLALLVVRPGAPVESSLLVARPGASSRSSRVLAPSSKARSP